MKHNQQYETCKLLGKMFPRYTMREAQEAMENGVSIEVFKYKALSGSATKHNLKAIA